MFYNIIMKRLSEKRRNIIFLLILLILSDIFSTPGRAQQAPEPKAGFLAGKPTSISGSRESGLLFYLSGNKGFTADFAAGGQDLPNYLRDVSIIPDGAQGPGFKAEDTQLMTYWAPGNIYAQRGTLSFFWRSRYPVGPTPFPIFRVGYADHSSWDMVWLRIDYNGSGFDAFVTDIGLSRIRISYYMDKFPGPQEWTHIAFSWDETEGVKLYINGELVAKQLTSGNVFDAGLDQFGPHSRIISPYQVQSAYNYVRGGDLDELRIYDRMLSDENITNLSHGKPVGQIPSLNRDLSLRHWRDAWWLRNGWNLPNTPPPLLTSAKTSIRKVEIHDAFDINRWFWKANDGIRETTWPGVYNMSRLPGRYDYFVLPDWDCYSHSGQSVKFTLPDEPWNHVEIWGKAWGQLTYESKSQPDTTFGIISKDQIKSYLRLDKIRQGGIIRFDNAIIEEPIGSFDVYNVEDKLAPAGTANESFILSDATKMFDNRAINDVVSFIYGRYPADERAMMIGVPVGTKKSVETNKISDNVYPFIHIILPYKDQPDAGLDGIELLLPALNVKPTHNGVFPLNIRVKDPLWQMRDLADFSFSVKPNESYKLWIDTRDRILPEGSALYITIAGSGADLTPELLNGSVVRLVYKSRSDAKAEHVLDRFTQVRDLYAHIVEEHPASPRLNLYNRIIADINDLLIADPDNWLAKAYRYAVTGKDMPEYKIAGNPDDTPEWAFLQVEYLRHLKRVIMYYIDNRQTDNGEFGGGLSDDDDLTNMFPGAAFLGIEPDKILQSLSLFSKAFLDQERPPYDANLKQRSLPLFTNGLATIFTDELHSYEDGIEMVGQLQLLDYGNPQYIEQGMATAKRVLENITQINPAGHRHIRSRLYSGTRMATEDPWQWSVPNSYQILHTSYLVALYNGNPRLRQMLIELADGLLKHTRDGIPYSEINFSTDEVRGNPGVLGTWQVFLAAYYFTHDNKYLSPISTRLYPRKEFNKESLVAQYKREINSLGIREYINTEGSPWIDRVTPYTPVIQQDRLGGVALIRGTNIFPQHHLSWEFEKPASFESAAIYVAKADSGGVDIILYNLEHAPVHINMTLWNIIPGRWSIKQGIDSNDDQMIDSDLSESSVKLENGKSVDLVIPPRKYTILNLKLAETSKKPMFGRPDLGISSADIKIQNNSVTVRVHSLGAVSSPVTALVVRDARGKIVARTEVASLEAPLDLKPRFKDVTIIVPDKTDLSSGSVELDPEMKIEQITRRNKLVKW